ncbi:MAG: TonB-dependent receptor [Agrobacterium cavarae]
MIVTHGCTTSRTAAIQATTTGYYASWIVPEGTQTSISAFIRDEVEVTDGFFITPGLRFDHVRMEGKPNAAPRYNNPLAGHDYSAVSYNGFTPALSGRWGSDAFHNTFSRLGLRDANPHYR